MLALPIRLPGQRVGTVRVGLTCAGYGPSYLKVGDLPRLTGNRHETRLRASPDGTSGCAGANAA
jgi:hypothetical protein